MDLADAQLPGLGATMTNFHLKLTPFVDATIGGDAELEVFFDDRQVTLEMHDVFVDGSGMVKDPETGFLELL